MSTHELRTGNVMGDRRALEGAPRPPHRRADQPSVPPAAFRQALSRLAAGTSILTTRDRDGHLLGLTATAVTAVSLEPPLVLVCVDNLARTATALQAHAPFVVHFLAAEQEAIARHFASHVTDKFAEVTYRLTANGCPRLEGVLASVECVPYQVYPGGDHSIAVGRVVAVQVSDADPPPLIYFRSQFLNC